MAFDPSTINHADVPGWLKSQAAQGLKIGKGAYHHLLTAGHPKDAIDAAIRGSGVGVYEGLAAAQPSTVFDYTRLSSDLKEKGESGGAQKVLGLGMFDTMVQQGHDRSSLKAAVKDAVSAGLGIGPALQNYLTTGERPAGSDPAPEYTPTNLDVSTPEDPAAADTTMADAMLAQIQSLQDIYRTSLRSQEAEFARAQSEQTARMESLKKEMEQASIASQLAARNRQQVLGVQGAPSSAGTPMQIAKRGTSGAFQRGGLRISSLNI